MSSLDSIINVTISRDTQVPTQQGFGLGNFLSNTAVFQERILEYGSLAEVEADPLAGADTVIYAEKYFGQKKRPTGLFVTKKGRDLGTIQTLTFSGVLVTGNTAHASVNGVAVSEPFTTDSPTTIAAFAALIAAQPHVTSAVVTGFTILVTGAVGFPIVMTAMSVTGGASQPTLTTVVSQYEDSVATITASMVAAENVNNDWYAVSGYSHADADILELAAYTQGRTKIHGASSSDPACYGSGSSDILSQLKALGYDRTFCFYSADAANFPEAGMFGGELPKDAGSSTWAYKGLIGNIPDNLNTTQKNNILAKNGMCYTTVSGISVTQNGEMSSGEFVDVIMGSDFIVARIQESVFGLLAQTDKIPFTNQGADQIRNLISQVLTQATTQKILAKDPAFTIEIPDVLTVAVVDKGTRTLPDVTFEGTLAGAIHKTRIQGTLVL